MSEGSGILSAPLHVDLLVTSRCNLHCLHCSASPEQFKRDDFTTEEILSLIDELAECKVFKLALTGGEPLLHPDFLTIAEAVVSHPIRLQINTNATLATAKMASRLAGLKRRPFISVSLDGTSAETHDRIRGRGSFEMVTAGIRTLADAGLSVRPFMVVSRINVHEVASAVDFTEEMRLESIFLSTPLQCGRASCYKDDMQLSAQQWRGLLEEVRELDAANPGLIDGPIVKSLRKYDEMKEGRRDEWKDGGDFRNCSAGRSGLAIGADGTVSPCQMLFSLQVGNLRDNSLKEIWRDSPKLNEIRAAWRKPLREVPGCSDCEWLDSCTGPCPVEGFLTTGAWPAAGTLCLRHISGWVEEDPSPVVEQEVLP